MKHLKIYEQFDFDDFSDEELFGFKDDNIKIGDKVYLINDENALYYEYGGEFVSSANRINFSEEVKDIQFINGEKCLKITGLWYKSSCFSLTSLLAKISKKEQYDFEDLSDEELFGKEPFDYTELKVGDLLELKNGEIVEVYAVPNKTSSLLYIFGRRSGIRKIDTEEIKKVIKKK